MGSRFELRFNHVGGCDLVKIAVVCWCEEQQQRATVPGARKERCDDAVQPSPRAHAVDVCKRFLTA
jgi:hypothetical protein